MGFMKKGLREANRKVIKDVKKNYTQYFEKFEYYGEIAFKISTAFKEVTDENLSDCLLALGYSDVVNDPMARFLILGQTQRLYEERNQSGEHKELSGGEIESSTTDI